jgi:hypothetical protein
MGNKWLSRTSVLKPNDHPRNDLQPIARLPTANYFPQNRNF